MLMTFLNEQAAKWIVEQTVELMLLIHSRFEKTTDEMVTAMDEWLSGRHMWTIVVRTFK